MNYAFLMCECTYLLDTIKILILKKFFFKKKKKKKKKNLRQKKLKGFMTYFVLHFDLK